MSTTPDSPRVVVVRTGLANLASILAGVERAGAAPMVSDDAAEVERADALVLPGVGSFGAAVQHLRSRGLEHPIVEHIRAGRPFLGICLGLQLLCEASEESPDSTGLGLVSRTVRRFHRGIATPQLGWNRVAAPDDDGLVGPGHAYFANSYRLVAEGPIGPWRVATAQHGGPFIAAIWNGPVLACQFHPELSGRYGLGVLRRWLSAARAWRDAAC